MAKNNQSSLCPRAGIFVFRLLVIILIIFYTNQDTSSQFYLTGQAPASVKWMQINTGNHQIIFPDTFQEQALRIAGILNEAWELTGHSLNHQPGKIPVVIHNQSARSNGMVVWAPKRMELYTTPPQHARGGDWLTQLAVHEQRHVVQVDKLNQGITRVLYFLFGEQSVGLAAGRLPLWFLEGDAVITETALTLSGRGRTPSFDMPLRALLMSRKYIYDYDKFLHGSYKDYVPDHYQYGYNMVSALRNEYGSGIWDDALNYVARRPYYFSPFSGSLRKQTGDTPGNLHKKVLTDIRNEWDSLSQVQQHGYYTVNDQQYNYYSILNGTRPYQAGNGPPGNVQLISDQKFCDLQISLNHDRQLSIVNNRLSSIYQSYNHPIWVGDSAIIALKTGIAQTDEFILLDKYGKEESLHFPGIISSPSFTFSGSRISWSEYQPDPRWGLRQYSVIKVFDITTGKERRISSQSRYFSPAFAPDGLFLAAVEVDLANSNFILIINSVTGETAARYRAPEGKDIQQPVFHPDGSHILLTSVCEKGMNILSLDLKTGSWQELMKPSYVNISGVFPCGDMVCYNSDISGVDNIFAMERAGGGVYKITESRFGAFNGSLSESGDKLVWSDYTAGGFDLSVKGFDINSLIAYDGASFSRDDLIETLASHEKGIITGDKQEGNMLLSEPYRKGLNLFKFHSWAPFYYDYSEFNIAEQPVYPGITFLSQNLLNTANTILGYSFKEGRHIAHGSLIYQGWYPVFETGFDYGDEPMVFMGRDSIGPSNNSSYNQVNLKSTIYLPLNLSSGRHIAGMEPWFRINYNNSLYHYDRGDIYRRGMTTIEARFLIYHYTRLSHRDLAPRWGQVLRWRMRGAPFESENLGTINALELTLYAPGLFPHHSMKLDATLQRQDPLKYYYNSLVSFPRGYPMETTEVLTMLKSSYSFPVMYPDLSVSGLFYLKRLYSDLFADFGMNRTRGYNSATNTIDWDEERLLSFGGILTANFYFLRMIFPVNISSGFAYIPERDKFSFLLSFRVNLDIF